MVVMSRYVKMSRYFFEGPISSFVSAEVIGTSGRRGMNLQKYDETVDVYTLR